MVRLLTVMAMALALVTPLLGAAAKPKPAKLAPATRTIVLDVTGLH